MKTMTLTSLLLTTIFITGSVSIAKPLPFGETRERLLGRRAGLTSPNTYRKLQRVHSYLSKEMYAEALSILYKLEKTTQAWIQA